ncbi:MAG: pentapeptide repeat-containing protein [Cyanobacteria bacterium J06639_14]
MADKEQLSILNEGVSLWHQWRKINPAVVPDLSNASLRGADLHGANLSGADLRTIDLTGTDLSGANLSGADLSGANLSGADLSGANLSQANLIVAKFNGADLSNVDFRKANLSGVDFSYTNLSKADFSQANLQGADLHNAGLSNATLHDVDLRNASLRSADLYGVSLYNANLSNADLSNADLSSGQAIATNFHQATLTGACLEAWNINGSTTLRGVICEYIYLRREDGAMKERRPRNGNFRPGEFTTSFQQILKTVDLAFADGIDWTAFFLAFQELSERYGQKAVSIQAIEKKRGESLVVRLEVPRKADKSALERRAKELYRNKLALMERRYRNNLRAKDGEIAEYRKRNTNLTKITEILALRQLTAKKP